MKPETESSGSKAKTKRKRTAAGSDSRSKKKSVNHSSSLKIEPGASPEYSKNKAAAPLTSPKHVSDLEFLDTVKETVYKKLLDNELDLKIDSGFKAIELKNKISETSENERLLLEILSEIRAEELSKS